jgi:hypothetical protein
MTRTNPPTSSDPALEIAYGQNTTTAPWDEHLFAAIQMRTAGQIKIPLTAPEFCKLIVKLRWIGMAEEAEQVHRVMTRHGQDDVPCHLCGRI